VTDSWKQWEGQTVDGSFPLLRYIGGTPRGAVFFTERREHGSAIPAVIKLVLSSAQKANWRLSRWRQTASLSHPQLLGLYETGRFELGAVPVVYVVMDMADENLAQVLTERALTPDEARAMLQSLLDVLGYLHSKGLVHGHIKPSNILAIGDQLKVSSDRVCRAGESLENPGDPDEYDPPEYARGIIPVLEKTSPQADIWSLGITLSETLTGNPPARRPVDQNPAVWESLPQPFTEIVAHCLRAPSDRWTVGQISDCLAGRTPARTPVRTAVRTDAAPPVVPCEPASNAGKRRGSKVLAAVAVLVVAIAAGLAWVRHESQTGQASTAQVAAIPAISNPAAPGTPQAGSLPGPDLDSAPAQNSSPKASRDAFALSTEPRPAPGAGPAPPLEPTRPNRAKPLQEAVDSGVTGGEVTRQVMPNVSESALATIQGTVKVGIKVEVGPSGAVTDAQFESQGPSKYFARAAMEAAQNWKFEPAEAGGRQVPSSWELQFEFDRDGAKVVPTQTAP
jgi:TonB family protein